MNTQHTYFVKAVTGAENMIEGSTPQIACIGRSNVGKSSVINALCNNKKLARSSNTPGRTQEINFFMFQGLLYLVDLPGYGYAKASRETKSLIRERILWYFFQNTVPQALVILIVDAKVLPTIDDIDMFEALKSHNKQLLILANKIDKLTQSERASHMKKIRGLFYPYEVLPFSAEKKIGVEETVAKLYEASHGAPATLRSTF